MVVKEAGLSPEVVEYLSELRKFRAAKPHCEVRPYYVVVPYREIRNNGSESREFLFYAKVADASLEEAKKQAQRLLGRSGMEHRISGLIQGWVVDEAKVREASPRERKLCDDYTLEGKF
jgi:hypothetical protein